MQGPYGENHNKKGLKKMGGLGSDWEGFHFMIQILIYNPIVYIIQFNSTLPADSKIHLRKRMGKDKLSNFLRREDK